MGYTCIELEAGLVGEDLQLAARRRMTHHGHQPRPGLPVAAHHKVMVEAWLISFYRKKLLCIGFLNLALSSSIEEGCKVGIQRMDSILL